MWKAAVENMQTTAMTTSLRSALHGLDLSERPVSTVTGLPVGKIIVGIDFGFVADRKRDG